MNVFVPRQAFVHQILRGLQYLHGRHVYHRDLKVFYCFSASLSRVYNAWLQPRNILVNANCELKVILLDTQSRPFFADINSGCLICTDRRLWPCSNLLSRGRGPHGADDGVCHHQVQYGSGVPALVQLYSSS